jgi:mRNA interferase MazF
MIDFDSGDVALVRFPFTNQQSVKQRPAVIVNQVEYPRQYGDFVLIPLTSVAQTNPSLALRDWRDAGLLKPTWVKPIIATLNQHLIVRILGSVTVADHTAVRAAIEEIFAERWLAWEQT